MDAETWGGETVVVICPHCGRSLYKGRTQARTQLSCPCSQLVITSERFNIHTSTTIRLDGPPLVVTSQHGDLIEQLEAGLGEGG